VRKKSEADNQAILKAMISKPKQVAGAALAAKGISM
jgi:hypothetical protein